VFLNKYWPPEVLMLKD